MRKTLTAVCTVLTTLVLGALPGAAGTSADPEIADIAGDANFINGQGIQPGHEEGPDSRPASIDNTDLRAVWFETAYTTNKVFDPETGDVLRVEYHPTALAVHVQTQGPARPMDPWNVILYKVQATLPGCTATFELSVRPNPPDVATIWPVGAQCGDLPPGSGAQSPVTPTFEGTVSTITFPLTHFQTSQFISNGTTIAQPAAHAIGRLPSLGSVFRADETVAGPDFTIGQDVPPNVDCTADPDNPECQP